MLTTDDFRKIGELFEQLLEAKLEEKLEAKFEEKLASIRKDIRLLKNSQRRMRKDMNMMLKYLDNERF